MHCSGLALLGRVALWSSPKPSDATAPVKPRSSKSRHAAPGKNTNFEHGTIIWYRKDVNTILCRMQMCMGFLILCSAANELIFANICTVFTYLRDSDMRPVNNSMRGGTTHQPKSTTATPKLTHICLSQFCLHVLRGKIVYIDNSLLG